MDLKINSTYKATLPLIRENEPIHSINLLVITDNSDKAMTFIRNFESTGINVYCVNTKKEALNALKGKSFTSSRVGENCKPSYNGIDFQIALFDESLDHCTEGALDVAEDFKEWQKDKPNKAIAIDLEEGFMSSHSGTNNTVKLYSCSDSYDERLGLKLTLPSVFDGVILQRDDASKVFQSLNLETR